MVLYGLVAVLIRSILEGVQKALAPIVLPEFAVKAAAFVLSLAATVAYNLNPLAEAGLKSNYPAFDMAAGAVILWVATLGVHDILDAVKNYNAPKNIEVPK